MNTELLFQTVNSVNQISVFAAITDWCVQHALTNEEKEHVAIPVDIRILAMVEPEEVDMLISSPNVAQGIGKRYKRHNYARKPCSSIWSQQGIATEFDRWRRRMGRDHFFMQRIHLFSSLSTSQTIGSYSSRNNCRTDL